MHKSKMKPKISIITPSFNQSDFIEETILSVLNQNYANFEHIVIDGGSTDGTINILKKYPHLIWISEKDEGQADALNKGLAMASGEIIGWLNSDDYYLVPIFEKIGRLFQDSKTHWVIGDLILMENSTQQTSKAIADKVSYRTLTNGTGKVRAPSSFYSSDILKKVGGWDKRFYMILDHDLWIRLSKISEPVIIHQPLAVFRHHEDQISGNKNSIKQIKEFYILSKREKRYELFFYRSAQNLLFLVWQLFKPTWHLIKKSTYRGSKND